MSSTIVPYDAQHDFDRVARMLVDTYPDDGWPDNWLRMRWEYMHYHPLIWELDTRKIGLIEDRGAVTGVVHFEHQEGATYIQTRPGYEHLKPDLVEYAERTFRGQSRARPGWSFLGFYVNEWDEALAGLLGDRGYERMPDEHSETMSRIDLGQLPDTPLPPGYRLQSLAEEDDLRQVNNVLWRGFNHEGPPPDDEIPGREFMQRAPHFRKDLTIVAVAPNGDYASFGGLWVEHAKDHAMVEPVATDPDYRRLGLGTAVVVESLRRAANESVGVAWVGTALEFYLAMGFEKAYDIPFWVRYFR
jgi:GNAT superfamily N-acetyltransferase